jgi:Sec1 family
MFQEFYADFCAIDPYHFTLNINANHVYMLPTVADPHSSQVFCDRAVDGISAVFLALKKRPVIRYQCTSDIAKRIAQETAVCNLSDNISFFGSRFKIVIEIAGCLMTFLFKLFAEVDV